MRHSRRILQAHPYYHGFVDHGDAENDHVELSRLRATLKAMHKQSGKAEDEL